MIFQLLKDNVLIEKKEFGDGSFKIGRAENCALKLSSSKVSKQHALLLIKNNQAAIMDLGSKNGLFINGILVKKQKIQVGDKITIDNYTLKITY